MVAQSLESTQPVYLKNAENTKAFVKHRGCTSARKKPAGAHPVAPNSESTDSLYVEQTKEDSVYVSVSCPAGVYTNEAAVKRIKISGKIGKWTSLNASIVANYIVNGVLNGKRLIIPGIGAKFLMILMKLLPENLNRWIVGRNMKRNISAV